MHFFAWIFMLPSYVMVKGIWRLLFSITFFLCGFFFFVFSNNLKIRRNPFCDDLKSFFIAISSFCSKEFLYFFETDEVVEFYLFFFFCVERYLSRIFLLYWSVLRGFLCVLRHTELIVVSRSRLKIYVLVSSESSKMA
jgi:hypothetical protein